MEFDSTSLLLYLVLGIFGFCYLVATWVWIKVDAKNKMSPDEKEEDN